MRPFSMRLALAVVPPMSKEMRFERPIRPPSRCARDDPGRGPRLDGGGGHPERPGHVEDPAARPHDVEPGKPEPGEGRFQPLEVGGEDRPDVGADGGRARALELADLREDLARQEHREAGERRPQPFADPLLVRVVEEREHEADGDRVHTPEPPDRADERIDLRVVEGGDDLALGVDPLG